MYNPDDIVKIQEKVQKGILNTSWTFDYTEDRLAENPFYYISGFAKSGNWAIELETLCGHKVHIAVKSGEKVVYEVTSSEGNRAFNRHAGIRKLVETCLKVWIEARNKVASDLLATMPE